MLSSEFTTNDSSIFAKSLLALAALLESKDDQITKQDDQIQNLDEELENYKSEVTRLHELIDLLRKQQYAPKSEVLKNPNQLGIFNEAEVANSEEEGSEVQSYRRGKPKRKPLPDHLPVEEVRIELSEKERVCPKDGSRLKEIGEESSDQLDYEPAKLKIIRTIRKKYACPCCDEGMKTAPLPPKPIPKGLPTAGLLAAISVGKYADGLPLYRQEQMFKRMRVELPRGTMASWMIKVGELLQPIWNLLEEELLESDYLRCDETGVQVLKEPGKKATSTSYMWVRSRAGPDQSAIVLFDYASNRSGKVAEELLDGFEGYLQVDGYVGYDKVCQRKGVTRVGCWAHCRRGFVDAYKSSKKKGISEYALKLIRKLYAIEKCNRGNRPKKRYEARQAEAKPILEKFRKWLDDYRPKVVPESLLGKAITYAHNEWPNLIQYIEDGRLDIDNNYVENKIRPFAVGRRNWLFSDSVGGANASATIYSIIETVKANGLEPYSYLRHVLGEIPKATKVEEIEELLPHKVRNTDLMILPSRK